MVEAIGKDASTVGGEHSIVNGGGERIFVTTLIWASQVGQKVSISAIPYPRRVVAADCKDVLTARREHCTINPASVAL
jgi:hypothetical protein